MQTGFLIFFFCGLFAVLIGMPVAAVLGIIGTLGGILIYGEAFLNSMGSVIWGMQNSETLTAIPLFMLMGEILLRSGIADNMYRALAVWLNWLPGRLLHTNIGTCALFAATTGASIACSASVGTVAIPALYERGYEKPISLGSLAAGGTLGILIPPSVALLVYGSITSNSIGKLFVAGIIPGVLLTLAFSLYILIRALIKGQPEDNERYTWKERFAVLPGILPPLSIFIVVMGSIYFGWSTPTESASLGVIMALGLAALYRRCTWDMLTKCFVNTAQIAGMVLLIMASAYILNLTISMLGIPQFLTAYVTSLGFSFYELMLVLIVFYLILGMFMDVLSMQVATIPIAYPIVVAAGGDPIWFGIFIVLMSEMAMLTPPMGMHLFVLQGIRPDPGPLKDVLVGSLPFVAIMMVFSLMLLFFPEMATWLPSHMQ